MNARAVEIVFIALIMVAVLVGGRSLIVQIAQFHGLTIAVLGTIGMVVVYGFRRSFLAGGPLARLHATRDAAFLASIVAAIVFTASPARWSIGAAVVGVEFALILELLSRFTPASPRSP